MTLKTTEKQEEDEELKPENFKWNIEPHPYDSSFDVFVTNDDQEASEAIQYAAEMYLWDSATPGQENILKVRCNRLAEAKEKP